MTFCKIYYNRTIKVFFTLHFTFIYNFYRDIMKVKHLETDQMTLIKTTIFSYYVTHVYIILGDNALTQAQTS